MPTNLPPEALEAERRYREAESPEEKIATLEEYISAIPKHKGTDHLRADLRRKLSKLKSGAQARKKAGRHDSPYHIDREGAGQVVIAGPTNAGKSSLLAALTNATPEVSSAPFTTWTPADVGLDATEVGSAGAKAETVAVLPPPDRPPGRIVPGEPAVAAKELVRLLREEAMVI